MGLWLYNLALVLTLPLAAVFLLWQILVTGKFRSSWRQRLTLDLPSLPPGPVVHVHAASMGEAISLVPLLPELRRHLPGHAFLVTSLSETGARAVSERVRPDASGYLPLDYPPLVRRFLDRVRPRLILLMETEFWPNLIAEATRRGIPVVVANGRVSPGTIRRYHRFSFLYRPLVGRIARFAAQSDDDAERARAIGFPADRVVLVGDVKFDQIAANPTDPRLAAINATFVPPGPRVLVAGSTHPGEHEPLLDGFARRMAGGAAPPTWLVLAPRHPEARPAVERHLSSLGLSYLLRSRQRDQGAVWERQVPVLLVDTMGELAFLYDRGAVAFVGGSYVPVGGHSPLEPAVLGRPVLVGPRAFNFRDANGLLAEAHALEEPPTMEAMLDRAFELLSDEETARAMGARGRDAVLSRSGSSARTAGLVADLLV